MFTLTPSHRFPKPGRLVATSALVWLLASVVVAALGWSIGWPSQWHLVLLIGLLSLVVAILSTAPLHVVRAAGTRFIPAAVLASTTVRLCLTVALAVGLSEMEMAPRQTIGLWAILWYALMMMAELSSVIRYSVGQWSRNRLPAGEPKVQ